MQYVDIGANLCSSAFREDLAQILKQAQLLDVMHILVTASHVEESHQAIQLCQKYPEQLAATAGVHPHQASQTRENFIEQLRGYATCTEVKAIGEMGLDFNRNYSPAIDQEAVFEAQLALAAEVGKPVFLHERDATERFQSLIKPWIDQLQGGVLHCFTGTAKSLDAYLDMGLYIGVTGWICDPKRGHTLRELVRKIPDDRLLIETDAPYLPPKTMTPTSKRNEPAFLPEVAKVVAQQRGQSLEQIARLSYINAQNLFNWPKVP